MNKMLILLQQLHLENEVNELKRATIEKVVVNADNSYVFYIVASHIVPLEEIRVLFAAKNEFPYPCDFIFDWMGCGAIALPYRQTCLSSMLDIQRIS